MPDKFIEFKTEVEKEQIIIEQEALGNEVKVIHFGLDENGNRKKHINFKTDGDAILLKKQKVTRELNSIGADEFELVEEIIDILIAKTTIKLSDLSNKAKAKYEQRKKLKTDIVG